MMHDRVWQGLLWMGVALGLGAGGIAALSSRTVEPAASPQIREGAVLTVNPATVRDVDLAQVHQVLVPDWVGASGGIKTLYWERLRRAVDGDENLAALLDRMGALVEAGPAEHVDELKVVVQAWNDVVAAAGVPYRLAGELGRPDSWWLKSYLDVLDDAEVLVDGAGYGVTVRRRLDTAAPADAWLGQLSGPNPRVIVLLDRVTSFTLDRIWPLLDPVLDSEMDSLAAHFAPAVRASVARVLSDEQLEALRATAEDRYWLLAATDAIHGRSGCGSSFRVQGLPWNGLEGEDLAELYSRARQTAMLPCPEVTEREALTFAVRSMHVRQQEGVRAALERLVAFVAEVVVTHEARHAADLADRGTRELSCTGCPDELSPIAIWEGSAYLATFGEPAFAALALYQACDIDPALSPERSTVVRFLADSLTFGGCEGPVPADLDARARALERRLFGRSGLVELRGFPTGLPVSSEYGSR